MSADGTPVPPRPLPWGLARTSRKPAETFEVRATPEEILRSQIDAIAKSVIGDRLAVLDLARSPLPEIRTARRIIAVAERNQDPDLEAKLAELAAGMAKKPKKAAPRRRRKPRRAPDAKPRVGPPSVFSFGIVGDLPGPDGLTAAGKPPVVQVVTGGALWLLPDAVSASVEPSERRKSPPSGQPGSGPPGPGSRPAGRRNARRRRRSK